jgi:hypothetical protein
MFLFAPILVGHILPFLSADAGTDAAFGGILVHCGEFPFHRQVGSLSPLLVVGDRPLDSLNGGHPPPWLRDDMFHPRGEGDTDSSNQNPCKELDETFHDCRRVAPFMYPVVVAASLDQRVRAEAAGSEGPDGAAPRGFTWVPRSLGQRGSCVQSPRTHRR